MQIHTLKVIGPISISAIDQRRMPGRRAAKRQVARPPFAIPLEKLDSTNHYITCVSAADLLFAHRPMALAERIIGFDTIAQGFPWCEDEEGL